VICRDRAGYFAEGARRGAPDAIQIADRWHLLANLSAAVERVLSRNKSSLQDQPAEQSQAIPDPTPVDGALARRIAEQQPRIQQMVVRGWTISAIARELGLDRKTVRRYACNDIDELMNTGVRRGTLSTSRPVTSDPLTLRLACRSRTGRGCARRAGCSRQA
jgi:DNA-binding NarL/FixJ family response regulator